eukprot:gene10089-biopygen38003
MPPAEESMSVETVHQGRSRLYSACVLCDVDEQTSTCQACRCDTKLSDRVAGRTDSKVGYENRITFKWVEEGEECPVFENSLCFQEDGEIVPYDNQTHEPLPVVCSRGGLVAPTKGGLEDLDILPRWPYQTISKDLCREKHCYKRDMECDNANEYACHEVECVGGSWGPVDCYTKVVYAVEWRLSNVAEAREALREAASHYISHLTTSSVRCPTTIQSHANQTNRDLSKGSAADEEPRWKRFQLETIFILFGAVLALSYTIFVFEPNGVRASKTKPAFVVGVLVLVTVVVEARLELGSHSPSRRTRSNSTPPSNTHPQCRESGKRPAPPPHHKDETLYGTSNASSQTAFLTTSASFVLELSNNWIDVVGSSK